MTILPDCMMPDGADPCKGYQELYESNVALRERIGKLERGLVRIRDHWACSYDHPHCNTPMYQGSYGVGVVDGHRAAAIIARETLGENAP